jgi:hypothetical protein
VTDPRYVLITQCLQNDFFFNRDCRLFLPDYAAQTMLLGKTGGRLTGIASRRTIPRRELRHGPLGVFLEATIGRRLKEKDGHGTLHVINIRDWHDKEDSYDTERRIYGPHCEAGTWGAAYLEGLEDYLDPADSPSEHRARCFMRDRVCVYHIHADSLFDFKPRAATIGHKQRKFASAPLEDLLDVLVQGSDEDLKAMRKILATTPDLEALADLGQAVDEATEDRNKARLYLAVLGVYTDIKVNTVLGGIRTRYNLPNIAVSDTFTTSSTLERHLAGLHNAKKVLNVEVIHGINDLVVYLGGTATLENESDIVSADSYARYASFFSNQQNVLAYQNEKLQDYLSLTEKRALKVYATINRSNRFLIGWGSLFLGTTLVLSILAAFGVVRWEIPVVTGGLSLAQFIGVFFRTSATDLQRNLTNLAVFKMVLESHSLKTAFARYHLTTPQTLRELQTPEDVKAAEDQIASLKQQLEVIAVYDKADFDDLRRLGFSVDKNRAGAVAQPAEHPSP